MGKAVADAVLDAALNHIKTNAAALCVCTSEPTSYAEATSTYKLAQLSSFSSASTSWGSPANGDVSGRKIAVPAGSSISITAGSSASHIAVVSASALLYVTTCSTQNLTASGTVTVGTWDVEILDPA